MPVHEYGEVGGEGESGNMRVFEGFIEEKIKQARRDGVFNNVKGAPRLALVGRREPE